MPPPGYEPFFATVLDAPHLDAPRLVYADWLEEQGDPRGEFIRVQCQLAALPEGDPDAERLADRAGRLLLAHGDDWRCELPDWARRGCEFERGFVHHVTIWGPWRPHYGHHLSVSAPVFRLTLQNVRDAMADFAAGPAVRHLRGLAILDPNLALDPDLRALMDSAPALGPLRSLEFMGQKLGDTGAHIISLSEHLGRLRRLELVRCGVPFRGLDRLTQARSLTGLTWLDLSDNDLTDDCVRLLANSNLVGGLTRLCLNRNQIHLSGVEALAESPYLDRLTHLELDDNLLIDRAVPLLTGRFPHLRSLRVARNLLTAAGCMELQKAYGPRVYFGAPGER